MTANKRSTRPTLGKTDLRKVDAHKIAPEEYEDAPELTREQLDAGVHEIGGKPVNRGGRPKSEFRKEPVNLRLDPDVLAHYRGTGEGWQSRINAALRRAAKLGKPPPVMVKARGLYRVELKRGKVKRRRA